MEIAIIVVFVLGYLAIALEHNLHVDKAAPAIITAVLCWSIYVLMVQPPGHGGHEGSHGTEQMEGSHGAEGHAAETAVSHEDFIHHIVHHQLLGTHLGEVASILFFLIGAMTIVELVDTHRGFEVFTSRIKTRNKVKLLWIVCTITFFGSGVLDNLTTTIVMVSVLRKLVDNKEERLFFVSMIVIAANAGGAWSPIGDVTTTMLWIEGQITAASIVVSLIVPSIVCMVVPLGFVSLFMRTTLNQSKVKLDIEKVNAATQPGVAAAGSHAELDVSPRDQLLMLVLGVSCLIFVPIFKTITHLPPFMGMIFGVGFLWIVTDLLHKKRNYAERRELSVIGAIKKIDMPSVLFFLGILLAIATLGEVGILKSIANYLDVALSGNIYAINLIIGLLSAIVDNVPLVAAAQKMYDISPEAGNAFAEDGIFWHFLAYCAGTGGSALIIGSAAGVAAMGLEQINFVWYIKKVTFLAVLGYFAGAAYYMVFNVGAL